MRVKKSSLKRHKYRAPVAFLNQPWRTALSALSKNRLLRGRGCPRSEGCEACSRLDISAGSGKTLRDGKHS
jgi:hypothetical protein